MDILVSVHIYIYIYEEILRVCTIMGEIDHVHRSQRELHKNQIFNIFKLMGM